MAVGLFGVSWWIWMWSWVHYLIADHVAEHGPLPRSATGRAGIYSNGTLAEQQLSIDLESVAGLYPWGRLPLVLGVIVSLLGWIVAGPRSPSRVIFGLGVSFFLLSGPLFLLGDSMRVALDILE